MNEDFLTASDWQVTLDQSSEKAVGRFNKFERAEVNELFNNSVKPLAISSIASVCFTDNNTVELILAEIFATLVRLSKSNAAIKLNCKVRYLIIYRGTIQW